MTLQLQAQSVSEIVGQIKRTLESRFRRVMIEGEISNLSCTSSGHWYFTLSDNKSSLSAALFKMEAMGNKHIKDIRNGDQVVCAGPIGVYGARGTFQIIVKNILPLGEGKLKLAYEKLKSELAGEGLFDLKKKKNIPLWPKKIALLTALQGAALQDFQKIFLERAIGTELLILPTLMQGIQAPKDIIRSLDKVSKYNEKSCDHPIDTVVLCRGGGSLEDLWAFNDEELAYKLYEYDIPTISAVGHEVDYTISDYVCDLRCETPSAAAQVLSEFQFQVDGKLSNLKSHLERAPKYFIQKAASRLDYFHPQKIVHSLYEKHQKRVDRLENLNVLSRFYELTNWHEYQMKLDDSINAIQSLVSKQVEISDIKLEKNLHILTALSPNNILDRGFSYAKYNGKVIKTLKEFKKIPNEEELEIHYCDGIGEVQKCAN